MRKTSRVVFALCFVAITGCENLVTERMVTLVVNNLTADSIDVSINGVTANPRLGPGTGSYTVRVPVEENYQNDWNSTGPNIYWTIIRVSARNSRTLKGTETFDMRVSTDIPSSIQFYKEDFVY